MKANSLKTAAALLAGCAVLLLAGCESKGSEPLPETEFGALVKLAAGDAADSDLFGMSVAIDDSWAIVGAPGANGAGTDQGRAYVFQQSQGGTDAWGQLVELAAADYADSDFFGISVDISGDYAVVGAYEENGSGTNRGAAYVFYRNQGGENNWGEVKKLVAIDAQDNDEFGCQVAIYGDTIVVGASGEDGTGTDQGAAYVFYRDFGGENNWGQVKKLVAGDPADTNQFGYDVAVSGDTIVVGSPGESGEGDDRGAAYVFYRDLGGEDAWGQAVKLLPADPFDDTWFGTTVAVQGTIAVVGAAWDDSTVTNQGAAYVFYKDMGGLDLWGQVKKLVASDADDEDLFGYDVAIDGSYILAGAFRAAGGGTERGQAYIFSKDEGGADAWGEVQRLRASDAANDDRFGYSVAIEGLFLLVGALGEDGDGLDRGAAYVFKKL